jgi:hypothetical protein
MQQITAKIKDAAETHLMGAMAGNSRNNKKEKDLIKSDFKAGADWALAQVSDANLEKKELIKLTLIQADARTVKWEISSKAGSSLEFVLQSLSELLEHLMKLYQVNPKARFSEAIKKMIK